MRSTPNEFNMFGKGVWNYTSNPDNIYDFWVDGVDRAKPFESVYSLGMRGAGDLPLEGLLKFLEVYVTKYLQFAPRIDEHRPARTRNRRPKTNSIRCL